MFANVDFVSSDTIRQKTQKGLGFEEEIARLSLTNSKFLFFWVHIRTKDYPLSTKSTSDRLSDCSQSFKSQAFRNWNRNLVDDPRK